MKLFNVYIIVAYAITVVIHNRRLRRIIDAIYEMRNKREERSQVKSRRRRKEKGRRKICEKRSLVLRRSGRKKQEEQSFSMCFHLIGRTDLSY